MKKMRCNDIRKGSRMEDVPNIGSIPAESARARISVDVSRKQKKREERE